MTRGREGCSLRSRGWAKDILNPAACRNHPDKVCAAHPTDQNLSRISVDKQESSVVCALSGEVLIFLLFAGSYGNLIPTPPLKVAPDTPSKF